jgi:uncharacterized protein YidB (DUF937 family)
MGLLDQVIGAALGSRPESSQSSPLMSALMALLASQAGGGTGSAAGTRGEAGPTSEFDGLAGLAERFRRAGQGDTVDSWIGTGQNRPISPNQLSDALGTNTVDSLARRTGMEQQDLLSQLAAILPGIVDQLTPQGRLPEQRDLSGDRDFFRDGDMPRGRDV